MKYTLEKKKELINARPVNQDITSYCNDIGISKASYYKWMREIDNTNNPKFVEITPPFNLASMINIEVGGVVIHVEPDYDANLLLNIINTLKQL